MTIRHLILVLGDQLSHDNPALAGFDPSQDRILMVEAPSEARQVWSHKARIALFLSTMRHFAAELVAQGWPVDYLQLGLHPHASLMEAWVATISRLVPEQVIVCEPGEWRLEQALQALTRDTGVPVVQRPDSHFIASREAFLRWAGDRPTLLMEHFYRSMRKQHRVLMEGDGPAGGVWNFDKDNRQGFGRAGPTRVPTPPAFAPDDITRQVLAEVEAHFSDHPGSLAHFAWPVTRDDALAALGAFVRDRLPGFGSHQDAMWTGEPFLWHSLLAPALNLKLLDPREVIRAAEAAWQQGHAPLPAVEGFIRQILGWREFIRGVYWRDQPGIGEANHFGHTRPLPAWFWTGETRMNCQRQVIRQTLDHGYAHHIQRLMVTGNFALLAGLSPQAVAAWFLAVYVDAVEWVELPNVAGMALYANGGRFTSKPYVASGAYIKRMSNYCAGCSYSAEVRTGPRACPVTTFYWNFIDRHEASLATNPRALLMVKNLHRLSEDERTAIRQEASRLATHLEHL
ncbi:cryptochrome/photolyase family protein [Zoogloea sp.]|uniref:cryptochrome/photolyase family protein n=1 Tax=Zoogloea sp. TaxID=49181 RepID=UPI002620C903|nr:cryptochrome/photolyase family protein [Zoogloea sp.]MDD3354687.1 cryptochrome/photolyase family protein [Zoogloea sp.]